VGLLQGTSLVLDVRAEGTRGELELQLLDPAAVGVAEEETDHEVIEDPVHEHIDDLTQALRAYLFV
jgi:hypothetical protein